MFESEGTFCNANHFWYQFVKFRGLALDELSLFLCFFVIDPTVDGSELRWYEEYLIFHRVLVQDFSINSSMGWGISLHLAVKIAKWRLQPSLISQVSPGTLHLTATIHHPSPTPGSKKTPNSPGPPRCFVSQRNLGIHTHCFWQGLEVPPLSPLWSLPQVPHAERKLGNQQEKEELEKQKHMQTPKQT